MRGKLKILGWLVIICITQVVPAWAGFEAGVEAYKRGDYATALEEWRPLAQQGNLKAQAALGNMYLQNYLEGKGAMKDFAEAAKWYRMGAEQGDARMQFMLGNMYDTGSPLQDYKESVRWYRKAASQGSASAQASLGQNYQYGIGVPQDYVKAYAYLSIAAREISTVADLRDELVMEMTPAAIAKAERMARDCAKKNYKECEF